MISTIGSLGGFKPGAVHPEPRSPAAEAVGDRFTPSSEEPFDLRRAARALHNVEGLAKARHQYRPAHWMQAEDRSFYTLYKDGEKGYLAAADPDGRIKWESGVELRGWSHRLEEAPEGVLVRGSEEWVAFGQDGAQVARGVKEGRPERPWRDATGVRYGVDDSRHLVAWSPDGSRAPTDPSLADLTVLGASPTPEGGLLLRGSAEMVRLAPGGAVEWRRQYPLEESSRRVTHSVRDLTPLPGGDVLLEAAHVVTIDYRGHRPPMRFGIGMGMGGHFDPDYYTPEFIENAYFVRVSPEGEVRWRSQHLGSSPRTAVLPDGTVLAAVPADKETVLQRIGADGQATPAFGFPGSVTALEPGPSEGELTVAGIDRVEVRGADGTLRAQVALEGERERCRFQGLTPDGRALFEDSSVPGYALYDFGSSSWTRLTDAVADHSISRAVAEVYEGGAPEEAPQIEVGEEYLIVDGVGLEREAAQTSAR